MISVICIKSGKKKLPPADVIPEVCFFTYFFIDKKFKLCGEKKLKLDFVFTPNSITSLKKDTKTVTDTQTRVNLKIPTVTIQSILEPRALQQEWR